MSVQLVVALLAAAAVVDCTLVYSSFWAPLFDRRVLNYRVDAPFAPAAGQDARDRYRSRYGPRGVNLIADLGNGKGPGNFGNDKGLDDVKFLYTYPGAPAGQVDPRYYYTNRR